MDKVIMPINKLNKITNDSAYVGDVFNAEILYEYGLYILKGILPKEMVLKYYNYYIKYKKSAAFEKNYKHLTEVNFKSKNPLVGIINESQIKILSALLFPKGAGVYNLRIVKKDCDDVSPVFLHQDIGYQHGSTDRYSLFVPLTNCDSENGGLIFYPGTHNFGYLGDAGAINESIIPTNLKNISPFNSPGDVIIMNSFLWHKSGENRNRKDRIYYDIHVNKFDDPANKYIIHDDEPVEYSFNYNNDFVFLNSRLQRLNK